MKLKLNYQKRTKFKDKKAGLTELSGLSFSSDGKRLYTVGDETSKVFVLDMDGNIKDKESFPVITSDLEGIAVDPDDQHILIVSESHTILSKYRKHDGHLELARSLHCMEGYGLLPGRFEKDEDKGLEGCCVQYDPKSIVLVKEGDPRLAIRVSYDLKRIEEVHELSKSAGFDVSGVSQGKLDVSGVCYDVRRRKHWIVSDKGQCVFVYDWGTEKVVARLKLEYEDDGKQRLIDKPEGIALHPDMTWLYIVSDEDGFLYEFKIRDE